jgi:hypothetical protein
MTMRQELRLPARITETTWAQLVGSIYDTNFIAVVCFVAAGLLVSCGLMRLLPMSETIVAFSGQF